MVVLIPFFWVSLPGHSCDAAIASSNAVAFLLSSFSLGVACLVVLFSSLSLGALCVALLSSPSLLRIVGRRLPFFVGFVWLVG